MIKANWTLRFIFKLSLFLLVAFCGQIFYYHYFEIKSSLFLTGLSYAFNFLLAIFTIIIMSRYRHSHTERLGYIFLVLSLLKLLSFYFGLYPLLTDFYTQHFRRLAFFVFFVPYSIALTMEIIVLIKRLNQD